MVWKCLAGLVAVVALAGALYQAIAAWDDDRRFPGPGWTVLGHRIYCIGAGSPTVILEAGLGDGLNEWAQVQPRIAEFSRVCSYDRAGYGASDPGPMPRTSAQAAGELHALLEATGERPPYLLVGHSLGGYNVRVFNGAYPDQVSGIVLVDSVQEDQYDLLPKSWNAASGALLRRYRSQARWAHPFIDLGVARLTLRLQGARGSFAFLQPKFLRTRASELEFIRVSAEQARHAGGIAGKPLIVLTAGENADAEFRKVWVDDLQVRLAHLSTKGKRVIVDGAGHDIPHDRPQAIVDAVRDVAGR
ncbi:MAG TPA: alpha/beta hydrolase [Bryobacteraceae bacterium]|nr:alpha/beta hydrolase [Bryobacteraceae bacterium]